jgi:3-hydroxyethyl bacteriochlorophyllide a dehydrogenase
VDTVAVVFEKPQSLALRRLALTPPGDDDVTVDVEWTGISGGTERLLWSGDMPPFPGMGYPLVPGYESVGRVAALPDLIVGHGALGRLLARLTLALGGAAPTVWENNPVRRAGAEGYAVCDAADDDRRDYRAIYDVSGAGHLLDALVARLAPGGEIVLAGFYHEPLTFAFTPAFLREARLRVAAQWQPGDLARVSELAASGALSLGDLITHRHVAADAVAAYATAFTDPACVKMVLDWRHAS